MFHSRVIAMRCVIDFFQNKLFYYKEDNIMTTSETRTKHGVCRIMTNTCRYCMYKGKIRDDDYDDVLIWFEKDKHIIIIIKLTRWLNNHHQQAQKFVLVFVFCSGSESESIIDVFITWYMPLTNIGMLLLFVYFH